MEEVPTRLSFQFDDDVKILLVDLKHTEQQFKFGRDIMLDEDSISLKISDTGFIYCLKVSCIETAMASDFEPFFSADGKLVLSSNPPALSMMETWHPDIFLLVSGEDVYGVEFKGQMLKKLALLQ